jgi:exodeoxyribonuclease VII large subunit
MKRLLYSSRTMEGLNASFHSRGSFRRAGKPGSTAGRDACRYGTLGFPCLLLGQSVANWAPMAKPSKSQWDFGELFTPEQTRRVLSVSELTTQVKRLLEQQVGTVWVTGEITNFRSQGSGHCYFTLKDASTQLTCVLFRSTSAGDREMLRDGQKVIVQGEVTVYEARGQYQLIVRKVELQGVGALQAAFERLKQKLAAEGLFAPERKRPLPEFSQRIGLVTSPTGAAIRDVLHVVQRRNPGLEIVLVPCRVQGDGAANEIAEAIRTLNEFNLQPATCNLDLILITRGGGSLEDLWAFNEEVVARAIAASAVPVVSAVGHEIDFTIADFVADARAATPSAAAEIITEGVYASRVFVAEAPLRLRELCWRQLEGRRDDADHLLKRLARLHPRRRLEETLQRLDDLRGSLSRCAIHGVRRTQMHWQQLALRLNQVRPANRLKDLKAALSRAEARLRLLGPEQVLSRGYSITTDAASGKILRDAKQVQPGQRLNTRLKSGEVKSVVDK